MNRLLIATMVTAGLASPVAFGQSPSPSKPNQPAASAGQPAAQPAARTSAKAPSRIQLTSAAAIAGRNVLDRMGQEVGEIEYLMIDVQTGTVRYALIGSGGVFDIGEDLTPVPWSNLTVVPGDEYGAVTIDTDLDRLRQGQRFSREDIQRLTEPALVSQIVEYYATHDTNRSAGSSSSPPASASGSGGGQPKAQADQSQAGGNRTANNQTANNQGSQPQDQTVQGRNAQQAQSQQAQSQQGQGQQGQGHPAILVGREYITLLAPPALMSPDEIRGATVAGRNGDDIGDIDRVMVDTRRGRIPYVLVGRGGFLGMGEEWIPVPFQALSWSAGDEGFVLNANEEQLKRMQSLPKQDLPAQVRTSDLKKLYDNFGVTPYWQRNQG
ncbi:PRC-barrel domain-containing protein [Azospirillum sp. RWY-5-1]|uniref:PRC-barrel domain-containing protein n=1 Tax=Azospirillum oleiclasticum TaxID=2735135 RepID=A0ABX2T2R8_9PROT|nr:PRC-barrel domain-containing protein [Azospirillum oleiclasticum]NYZ11438.1 PRC-barrel domain-containing protein [Azospirillum oleiclasticum]NYZ18599.1 PRC-barrel domain-containing protein [Azospirillum oleiclasticum]